MPGFFRFTVQIQRQLKTAEGLIGYSMEAKPFSLESWTISVWEDQEALNKFVQEMPHASVMQALAPYMGKTEFAQWSISSTEIPLDWASAKARLNNPDRPSRVD